MTAALNSLSGWLSPLWEMSLTAAYVTAVVALMRLVLKKRAPRQVLCLLWLLVFARLLIPASFESPLSIVPDAEQVQPIQDLSAKLEGMGAPAQNSNPNPGPAQNPAQGQTGAAADSSAQGNAAPDAVSINPVLTSLGSAAPATAPAAAQPEPEAQPGFPWQALAAGVWLAGALAMGGYGLISYLRLKRRLYDAIRAEDGAWEHPAVGSPFILGMVRPRIYLPAGLRGQPRKFILCHERAHLRRLDHIVKPICWAALALHWFNPAVWAAFILMSKDIEAACDEAVIRRLGPRVKADYSATLLSLATNGRVPAPCPLAFDEGDAKGRIQNVLRYRRPALWIVVVSVVMAVLAAVCLLTDPVSARQTDEDPDASASQGAEQLNRLLDPWMEEVLAGRRNFVSTETGENVNIDLLNGAYPGEFTVTLSKLAIVDLDRDGINELILWPSVDGSDNLEAISPLGYLILRRQGDDVYSYQPSYRAFTQIKTDGTFHFSGSAVHNGYASIRFPDDRFTYSEITYCDGAYDADNEFKPVYFVDGRSAGQEEYRAAIAALEAKPDAAWYVFADGQLKYAPIRVPIPLDEYAQAAPVPDFLDADQQLLYRQTYSLYSHIFGADTEHVDDWPGYAGRNYDYQNPYTQNGASYVPATGLYANWSDFEQAVLSVFTQDFWNKRNGANGTETYINNSGILFYQTCSRGNTGNNTYFPETFRLVERTEDSITFITTAYYTENPGFVPEEGWDAYLSSRYDYVQDFPIHMVKTDGGWRFDEFYCPMTDYRCYRLSAYAATPKRPDSLENRQPGSLTQTELDYFSHYFDMGIVYLPNIRAMLLMSEYDRPEDIDLYALFYSGLDAYPEISQAEHDALGWNEHGETFKVSAAQMDAVLQLYTGLTLEQTNRVGLDNFRYLAETDAYYASHSGTMAEQIFIQSGQCSQDGAISLTYRRGELEGQYRTVTLERADGQYYRVLSNRAVSAPDSGPEPSAAPASSPEPASSPAPAASTACEHGLDDIRLEYVGSQLAARCNQDDFTYPVSGVTSANYGGTTGQGDGAGWVKEDLDGDGRIELVVYTTDHQVVSLKMVNGAPVTSTFDLQTLVDDFNQNSDYRLDIDNKIMEVSYQNRTKQAALDDGFWSFALNHGGGYWPEIWVDDYWCNRLTFCFRIHNGRGYDLNINAYWHLSYSANGRLQANYFYDL